MKRIGLVLLMLLLFALPLSADDSSTDTFSCTVPELQSLTAPGDVTFDPIVIGWNEEDLAADNVAGQANYAWKITLRSDDTWSGGNFALSDIEWQLDEGGWTALTASDVTVISDIAGTSKSADMDFRLQVDYDDPPGSYDLDYTMTITNNV